MNTPCWHDDFLIKAAILLNKVSKRKEEEKAAQLEAEASAPKKEEDARE